MDQKSRVGGINRAKTAFFLPDTPHTRSLSWDRKCELFARMQRLAPKPQPKQSLWRRIVGVLYPTV